MIFIYLELCNHYHNLWLEHFHHSPPAPPPPKNDLPPSFLHLTLQSTTYLLSVSTDLAVLDILHK